MRNLFKTANVVRVGLLSIALAIVVISIFASRSIWREAGLRAQQVLDQQRGLLITNALKAEIARQDHLPVVLALDADVQAALAKPSDQELARKLGLKLERLSREADTRALYVLDASGLVVAAGYEQSPRAPVGRDLSDRIYFKQAMSSGRSTHLGVEETNDEVRYYIAEAVGPAPHTGVTVVRIEFEPLERAWAQSGERVLVTDKTNTVFLTSDEIYKFRTFGASEDSSDTTEETGRPIEFDILEQRGPNASVVRMKSPEAGQRFMLQSTSLPEYGWTVHRLSSLSTIEADERDGGLIGGALSALIIFLVLYLVERQRAVIAAREAGNVLKREVERTTHELREANASLRTEVDERRRTELRLRETQNELVQAGKLAALGQMSTAIAHEINQPLAAIRTFIASSKIFLERGETGQAITNLATINKLAARMAAITAHLKTFARKSEPGHPMPVRVAQAIDDALFLTESQIKAVGAKIEKEFDCPDALISGYSVQLEQVIINLINNALDAVTERPDPRIAISLKCSDQVVQITVADNGPGLPPEVIARLFEPFVTSKPVGKGLGLGLSISYGIVQNFDGHIRGGNRPEGGAEIVVELPRLNPSLQSSLGHAHA